MNLLTAYIPMDRRQAIVNNIDLPEQTRGTALFADISGFTPLTGALAQELGPRRGAEELTRQLNAVYNALITQVHDYSGSVLTFTGDAITCWFDQDEGLRAVACAFAMQRAMLDFAEVMTPGGTKISLSIKTAAAAGPVRRFQIGEPSIQYIDALTGETLAHMAAAEHFADRGEVVITEQTAAQLAEQIEITEWRTDGETGERFAAIGRLLVDVPLQPWPELDDDAITEEEARQWILPPILERLQSGQAEYLAELRPSTPLFLKFDGIDFDHDPAAGKKLDQYIQWVQQVLARYEGFILQMTIGDKGSYLYTAFGAPIAHDDDSTRAVAAGLQLSNMPDELSFISSVQIGISQGRMRTGAYGGNARRTYGVIGEETNMAARLMGKAGNGQVFIRQQVADAVRNLYELEDLGMMKVKGREEPIRVYRVRGQNSASYLQPASMYNYPLVGRQEELDALVGILQQATGSGQVVRLEGSTGIGKSHLSAEFMQEARQQDWRVVVGSSQSISQSIAYTPWQQLFRTLLNFDATYLPHGDLNSLRLVRNLQRQVKLLNPDWILRLPLLGDLLGVPILENATTAALDPKLRQEALFALVVEMIQRWAQERPLLILLEDIHWIDEASLGLLLAVSRAIVGYPIMIMLVHRPLVNDGQKLLPELDNLPYYHHINLNELPPAALQELIQNQLVGDVSPLVVSLVQHKSHGNPFFAEELVDALRESGTMYSDEGTWVLSEPIINALRESECLVRENGHWVIQENAKLTTVDIGVPDSIYGTILSRLDRLPEAHKLTLKVASVIGRMFEVNLVHRSHPAQPAPLTLEEQTIDMANRDFIRLERPSTNPGELNAIYFFRHNTTQEVAYDTLLFVQRQQLHKAIGESLELINPDQVAQIAHHAFLGEDWTRALKYQVLSGAQNQQLFANTEAIDHYRKALQSAEKISLEETLQERLKIHAALGELLVSTGKYEAADEHLQAALGLAREIDDFHTQAKVCRWIGRSYELRGEYMPALEWLQNGLYILEDEELETAEAAELLLIAGLINTRQGNYDAALSRCERSINLTTRLGEKNVLARAYNLQGIINRVRGNPAEAITYCEKALALYEETNNLYGQGISSNELANVYFYMGRWTAADQYYRRAREIFSQIGDTYNQVLTDNNLGGIAAHQGRLDEAVSFYQSALRSMEQIGGSLWVLGALHMNLGGALVHSEQIDEAMIHLSISLDYYSQAQSRDFLPELHRLFAEAALATNDLEEATSQIEQALALAEELNTLGEQGNCLRVWGQIAYQQQMWEAAEERFLRSLEILQTAGEEYEAARTRLALAQLYAAQHKIAAMNEQLAQCESVFARLEAQLDLAEIEHLRTSLQV